MFHSDYALGVESWFQIGKILENYCTKNYDHRGATGFLLVTVHASEAKAAAPLFRLIFLPREVAALHLLMGNWNLAGNSICRAYGKFAFEGMSWKTITIQIKLRWYPQLQKLIVTSDW